jgi:hypothetical protein
MLKRHRSHSKYKLLQTWVNVGTRLHFNYVVVRLRVAIWNAITIAVMAKSNRFQTLKNSQMPFIADKILLYTCVVQP